MVNLWIIVALRNHVLKKRKFSPVLKFILGFFHNGSRLASAATKSNTQTGLGSSRRARSGDKEGILGWV